MNTKNTENANILKNVETAKAAYAIAAENAEATLVAYKAAVAARKGRTEAREADRVACEQLRAAREKLSAALACAITARNA